MDLMDALKENSYLVSILVAVLALVGVFVAALISAFVALSSSKRSTYIASVTIERSKWIEKLRGNIAELLSVLGAISRDSAKSKKAQDEKHIDKASARRTEADKLIALITLQLNPFDKSGIDQELIKLMPKLVEAAEGQSSNYRKTELQFVKHAQFLLKEEWEKVKSEAQGSMVAWWSGSEYSRRLRSVQYREFRDEGE